MNTKITQKLLLIITAFVCFGAQVRAMDEKIDIKTKLINLFNEHFKWVDNNSHKYPNSIVMSNEIEEAEKLIKEHKIDLNEYKEIFIRAFLLKDTASLRIFIRNGFLRRNHHDIKFFYNSTINANLKLACHVNDTNYIDYLIDTKTCLPITMLQILGANKEISLDLMYYIISKIDPTTSIKELFEASQSNSFKYYHFKNTFAKYDLMCALLKNNKKLGTTQEILRSILGYLTPDDLPQPQKFIVDIKKRMDMKKHASLNLKNVFEEKDEDLDKILDNALDYYEELVQKTNKKHKFTN